MKYAPVLIPTLNRYEHLKETVTSLSECKGADFTDLFIALDYPPSDEYMDGYNKIVEYLPTITGFRSVNIIKRESNYGVRRNPYDAMHNFIFQKYDRFIYSEDDNHFSPNFLEFMNKGFEKFENDSSVIGINGYRHFYDLKFGNNNYFYQTIDFSAWGFGMMTETYLEIEKTITKAYFRRKFLNPINWWRVGRNGLNRFLQFFYFFAATYDEPSMNDGTLSVFMALNKKVVVMPSISKVRNIGWDSSGNSFVNVLPCKELAEKYKNQVIDTQHCFTFSGNGNLYIKENRKAYKKETHDKLSIFGFFFVILKKIIPGLIKKIRKNHTHKVK